ncbi:DUF3010 family protein [Aeromonas caviae]
MRICGIELKGSEAILAVVETSVHGIDLVDIGTKKIPLVDGDCCIQVKSFKETFESFCRDNAIEKVVIKKRGKKGEFAGGADTFKMEGIIQVSNVQEVILVSPQSIAAKQKKNGIEFPAGLNKYQQTAFLTCIAVAVQ